MLFFVCSFNALLLFDESKWGEKIEIDQIGQNWKH